MDFRNVLAAPQRPKLKFGKPLSDVCRNGEFHPGLKDLFLKAYLSARNDEPIDPWCKERKSEHCTHAPAVLLALQSGPAGQGTLSQRISLKIKLERGKWLVPAQTPIGAPLWLLRHFFGRLPQPILSGNAWRGLSRACGARLLYESDNADVGRLVERISGSARALNQPDFEMLALLALLIRSFALEKQSEVREELSNDVLSALSQYFIASITARPFRPGLHTSNDKEAQPLLIFMAKYWRVIFQEMPKAPILRSLENTGVRQSESVPNELYKFIGNGSSKSNGDPDASSHKLSDSSVVGEGKEQARGGSNKAVQRLCGIREIGRLSLVKSEPEINPSVLGKTRERKLVLKDSELRTIINAAKKLDSRLLEKLKLERYAIQEDGCRISTNSMISLMKKEILRNPRRSWRGTKPNCKSDSSKNSESSLNYTSKDTRNQRGHIQNHIYSNSMDDEYFSFPNSEDSSS